MITLQELKEKLQTLDEVTLVETLELTASEIVDRCQDIIEIKYHILAGEFDDTTPWDND